MIRPFAAVSAALLLVVGCSSSPGADTQEPDGSQPAGSVTPSNSPDGGEPGADAGNTPQSPADAGTQATRVDGVLWRMTAQEHGFDAFGRQDVNLTAAGELVLAPTGGTVATDPAGAYNGGNYYNGGSYRYGLAISPIKVVKGGFNTAVPHFEVDTPPGTWVTIKLSARVPPGGRAST